MNAPMFFAPCALILMILFGPGVADAQSSPSVPPERSSFHLYALMGQSNMAGRGVLDEPQGRVHPQVLMLDEDLRWVPAQEPIHFDKPAIAGAGLGASFATAMIESSPEVTIGLIPCAFGGTPLARWQPGADLYETAVMRIEAAMRAGTLKGILWHQGESDSGDPELATTYAERLTTMIESLRSDLHAPELPFVAGKLGLFLAEEKNGKPSYWRIVNEQIASLPKLVRNTAVAESDGLEPKDDGVHFDTASLRQFGRRYATAMQSLAINRDRGELIFSDTFDRETLGEWKVVIPTFTVADGVLKASQGRDDHGAVGRVYRPMRDVIVEFRFRLEGSSGFNAVFDDKDHAGSHAGHICRVAFSEHRLRLGDDKEGVMRNDIFAMRRDPAQKDAADALTRDRATTSAIELQQSRWHHARIKLIGDEMWVALDGRDVGHLRSPGLAHETKQSFHFTVNGPGVHFDDVFIRRVEPQQVPTAP